MLPAQPNNIIGYDAREMWLTPAGNAHLLEGWTDENKQEWLIKHDVERPLSVDDLVWLSVFKADPALQHYLKIATGFVQNLWSNLEELRACLDREWCGVWKKCWLICVTICDREITYAEHAHWRSKLGMTVPNKCALQWRFLGYDVADEWLLSGLNNCTHISEPDFPALRTQFSPRINRFHLFDNMEDAILFRSECNNRYGDHAPFFVYGLYLIKKVE